MYSIPNKIKWKMFNSALMQTIILNTKLLYMYIYLYLICCLSSLVTSRLWLLININIIFLDQNSYESKNILVKNKRSSIGNIYAIIMKKNTRINFLIKNSELKKIKFFKNWKLISISKISILAIIIYI